MTEKPDTERRRWHVSKEIPLALIVSLLLQTGGIVWWVAKADSRLEDHEGRIEKIEQFENDRRSGDSVIADRLNRIIERLVRIETRLDYQPKSEPKETYDR